MEEPPTKTDNRDKRKLAAEQRLEFWSVWTRETDDETAKKYFASRERHWRNAIKAIEMESPP